LTKGPYENTLETMAQCVCQIKKEKGEVTLNSHQIHEECNIPFETARRYVDSSSSKVYQRELNLRLMETCPGTQIKEKCWAWGVEIDDPPHNVAARRTVDWLCVGLSCVKLAIDLGFRIWENSKRWNLTFDSQARYTVVRYGQ
jgi:hypothetical protein